MVFSDITDDVVARYARMENGDADISPALLLSSAKAYILGFTGLNEDALDEHEDLTIAALVLCSDMYDNRQTTVDSSNVNKVVESILGMHCVNLL